MKGKFYPDYLNKYNDLFIYFPQTNHINMYSDNGYKGIATFRIKRFK